MALCIVDVDEEAQGVIGNFAGEQARNG
jgi:hypothetical protein